MDIADDIDRCYNIRLINDFSILHFKLLTNKQFKYIVNDKNWYKFENNIWTKDIKCETLICITKNIMSECFHKRSEYWRNIIQNDKFDIYKINDCITKSNNLLYLANQVLYNQKFMKNLIKESRMFFII